ncbi:hypothetical protein SAMN04488068_2684 [Hydrocarboniphaga daqingensis]|jgi:uncharacterized protein YgfB (UPF0149 family)|uniref:YecA family protein n=1 Tax=Hydrocarboniphaga daqingensis TaxID=490188 RepID=A0A1M5QLP6_9GAMM|nr:UPF0149 family protein [Hydrocarboniphaga daqingensis]SHH14699.1 hypothetical protein SAMN04488068_2684 [Hydrocarboniphaga daqingensis]
MENKIPYADLAHALERLGSAEEASEFHGTLCGALCVQDAATFNAVDLIDADVEEYQPDADAEALLQLLGTQTVKALNSSQMVFAPLLPGDEIPLDARVYALTMWCQGFLYGLSSRRKIDLSTCSEELREIIQDLAQFTQAGIDAGDNEDIEESAYAELIEYIRVGAQLVFLELNPQTHRPAPDDGQPTLH